VSARLLALVMPGQKRADREMARITRETEETFAAGHDPLLAGGGALAGG
jgi:hypothetical protein